MIHFTPTAAVLGALPPPLTSRPPAGCAGVPPGQAPDRDPEGRALHGHAGPPGLHVPRRSERRPGQPLRLPARGRVAPHQGAHGGQREEAPRELLLRLPHASGHARRRAPRRGARRRAHGPPYAPPGRPAAPQEATPLALGHLRRQAETRPPAQDLG